MLWDVGAGTGSVSVEAAGFMPKGAVYAVEKKPEALELIKKNIEKFQTDCVHPVTGEAPKACLLYTAAICWTLSAALWRERLFYISGRTIPIC